MGCCRLRFVSWRYDGGGEVEGSKIIPPEILRNVECATAAIVELGSADSLTSISKPYSPESTESTDTESQRIGSSLLTSFRRLS
jgi:hypothetical protein